MFPPQQTQTCICPRSKTRARIQSAIILSMLLITGATGFIGRHLVPHLVSLGYSVRILLRPSPYTPILPEKISVEVVICNPSDEKGIQSALKGVSQVIHLASTEHSGIQEQFTRQDSAFAELLLRSALRSKVERFFFLSHLGADRLSAFPTLQAKGMIEKLIAQSGVPYTIVRSAIVFGSGDHFTLPILTTMRKSPGFFFLPGDGKTSIQPLWIGDLIAAIPLWLEDSQAENQVFSVGGPEYLTFYEVCQTIKEISGMGRFFVSMSPGLIRFFSRRYSTRKHSMFLPLYLLDYLAADRITTLDTLPRMLGIMPERFRHRLQYLKFRDNGSA